MRLLHLSDLHLGKRAYEYSLIEDQRYALEQLARLARRENVDAVLIAGDLYDKSIPPVEAVNLLDWFLSELSGLPVLIVSGNHDSPERLAFCHALLAGGGVHVSPVFDGAVERVTLTDEHGAVDCWLLPFVKPAHVRAAYQDDSLTDYTQALAAVVAHMPIDRTRRNVLLCHQFLTGAARSESEEIHVGGLDNVDLAVFADFDYVAAGHLHRPQTLSNARYCGAPLKYDFSEAGVERTATIVELGAKGDVAMRILPLPTLRDMRNLRGAYDSLTLRASYEGTPTDDYIHVTLTDEQDVPDALGKLRAIYPRLLCLDYDNRRTRESRAIAPISAEERQSPPELIEGFFELRNNRPMTAEQRAYTPALAEKIWEARA